MKQKALIYNNYLNTSGGGERSTLDLARALSSLGFEITIACAQKNSFSLQSLSEAFGIPEALSWSVFECENETEIEDYLLKNDFYLFANHTTSSFMPNKAPFGIYVVMFPFLRDENSRVALRTYNLVSCISNFTQTYVHLFWGEDLPTTVIPPPISDSLLRSSPPPFEEKEKLIILIGRFNVFGHHKRQLDAIEAFLALQQRGVLDKSWRFVVAGHLNPGAETARYFERCQELSQGTNVSVEANLSFSELRELYMRASVLWQFTGTGLPFGVDPGKCEHLGLAAMDCFAYGTIPMIYQRSGMSSLINYGVDGFSFGSIAELEEVMRLIAGDFGGSYHRELYQNGLVRRNDFSLEHFTSQLKSALAERENHAR